MRVPNQGGGLVLHTHTYRWEGQNTSKLVWGLGTLESEVVCTESLRLAPSAWHIYCAAWVHWFFLILILVTYRTTDSSCSQFLPWINTTNPKSKFHIVHTHSLVIYYTMRIIGSAGRGLVMDRSPSKGIYRMSKDSVSEVIFSRNKPQDIRVNWRRKISQTRHDTANSLYENTSYGNIHLSLLQAATPGCRVQKQSK
jgi:hypothetical protein